MTKQLGSVNFPVGETGTGSYVITAEPSRDVQFLGAQITNKVFQPQGNRVRVQVLANGDVRLASDYAVNHADELDTDPYFEELKNMSSDQLGALIQKVPELKNYLTNLNAVSSDLNQHAPKIMHALMQADEPMPVYNWIGAWSAAVPAELIQKRGDEPLMIDHGDIHFESKFEMMNSKISTLQAADEKEFDRAHFTAKVVDYIEKSVKLQLRLIKGN